MRTYLVSILLGLTTTVAVCAPLPAQAEARVYQVESGQESFEFDPGGLDVLESLGLSLASVENTAVPAPGYSFASELRDTDYIFSYDDVTQTYTPLVPAVVDFTGSFFFNVDTTKLALDPQLELGDLVLRSGVPPEFYFQDTVTTDLPLFYFEATRFPVVDLESQSWALDDFDLRITEEFSDFLVAAGASEQIAGLKIAEARTDREFTEVPEPGSALAILMAGVALAVAKRRRSA